MAMKGCSALVKASTLQITFPTYGEKHITILSLCSDKRTNKELHKICSIFKCLDNNVPKNMNILQSKYKPHALNKFMQYFFRFQGCCNFILNYIVLYAVSLIIYNT